MIKYECDKRFVTVLETGDALDVIATESLCLMSSIYGFMYQQDPEQAERYRKMVSKIGDEDVNNHIFNNSPWKEMKLGVRRNELIEVEVEDDED